MKKSYTGVMGALLASGIVAHALPAFAQEDKTFALVQINQQALFFNEMNRGATEAAEKAGVNLVIFNANNDSAQQNSAIETYIQEGVDGIAVVAIDVNGIMPAVEQADAAGIPVVAIDAILPEDGPQKAQIGVDNAQAGADLAGWVNSHTDGDVKMGVVGALNSYIQNVRKDGFVDALGDNVTVVNTVDGQNVQDVALGAAENLITANPDLGAIYATGEPALMGAIAAVSSQGKQDSLAVYGWDLTAQAIDAIDDGYVKAVIQQDPAQMGASAVDALMMLAGGDEVEREISVPVTIVTQDNVDDFRSLFE
ncbi:substrate-binding domain-containing protein [Paracoccus sp. Z330]|uniref:Substrate-binding domain-containing protein n=1 Tax=Paracoccus onchidii TaxID=3017813 RepID=A0ABT4ZC63_9RHOB|nr:substrate-binding domain-containing protein [Paracoccus onchidii]MDB6176311.1 substrate-binding domain-containing protein [Paracoccus onchidii]